MAVYLVPTLATLIALLVVFRLGHDGRRIYDKVNAPLPVLANKLTYRVAEGQDAIAAALALRQAGYEIDERYLRGDTFIHIALHSGSAQERELIRSVIYDAPTLEGAVWHPAAVVFLDEERGLR